MSLLSLSSLFPFPPVLDDPALTFAFRFDEDIIWMRVVNGCRMEGVEVNERKTCSVLYLGSVYTQVLRSCVRILTVKSDFHSVEFARVEQIPLKLLNPELEESDVAVVGGDVEMPQADADTLRTSIIEAELQRCSDCLIEGSDNVVASELRVKARWLRREQMSFVERERYPKLDA